MHPTPKFVRGLRGGAVLALAATSISLGACNDFLTASNPGAIEADRLGDSIYINLMVNGVIGEFQPVFDDVVLWSAKFSDEARNHHVFAEEVDIDLRRVAPENGTYNVFVYTPLQRARFMSDSVTSRLKTLLPDSTGLSLRIARVRSYGAYAYTLLAEQVCGVPYDLGPTLPADSSFLRAIARYTEARTIATAFKATLTAPPATNPADSIINFANVGIARANLGMGNWAAAEAAAALVTNTAFEWRSFYSTNSVRENNIMHGNLGAWTGTSVSTASNNISLIPFFQVAPDPRIPYPAANEGTQNGVAARVPNSPLAWSTYSGTAIGAEMTLNASVRISSYLEAQHILHEARLRQGNVTGALAFINARRAVGGQVPYVGAVTAAALLTELKDQRRRDLFLDAHRLGDIRRYLRFDAQNFYETGVYFGSTTGVTFGDQVCWPLPAAELQGNPQATQPAQAP